MRSLGCGPRNPASGDIEASASAWVGSPPWQLTQLTPRAAWMLSAQSSVIWVCLPPSPPWQATQVFSSNSTGSWIGVGTTWIDGGRVAVGSAVGFGAAVSPAWWQDRHSSFSRPSWFAGKGRTWPVAWHCRQSARSSMGWGTAGIGPAAPTSWHIVQISLVRP